MVNNTKQVIIIRRDLKMRRGKEIAQGAHGSAAVLSHLLQELLKIDTKTRKFEIPKSVLDWINNSFTKVVLQVDSEQALLDVYNAALTAGVTAYLITDKGLTEFHGIPTNTVVAIGPDYSDKIDPITSHLKLY